MNTENESTELTTRKAPLRIGHGGLALNTLDDAWRAADMVVAGGFAPKGMQKAGVLCAIQLGMELGLPWMAAIQNIAVINGKPSIYGDMALSLVRASGKLAAIKEEEIGEPSADSWGYRCTVKRHGFTEASTTFTVADAKRADLWGKAGPWKQYPKRMLQFRARGFALRDAFGDVLNGMQTTEEVMDIQADIEPVTAKPSFLPPVASEPEKPKRKRKPQQDSAQEGADLPVARANKVWASLTPESRDLMASTMRDAQLVGDDFPLGSDAIDWALFPEAMDYLLDTVLEDGE